MLKIKISIIGRSTTTPVNSEQTYFCSFPFCMNMIWKKDIIYLRNSSRKIYAFWNKKLFACCIYDVFFHVSLQEKGTSSPLHPGIGSGGIDKDHSSLGGLVDGIGSIGGAGDFSLAGECFHILNNFTAWRWWYFCCLRWQNKILSRVCFIIISFLHFPSLSFVMFAPLYLSIY